MLADDNFEGGVNRKLMIGRVFFWSTIGFCVFWFLLPAVAPTLTANNSPFPSHALSGLYKIENGSYDSMIIMKRKFGVDLLPYLKDDLGNDSFREVVRAVWFIRIYKSDAEHLSESLESIRLKWIKEDRFQMIAFTILILNKDVESLIKVLENPDPIIRMQAVMAISDLGRVASRAYPYLLEMNLDGVDPISKGEMYDPVPCC